MSSEQSISRKYNRNISMVGQLTIAWHIICVDLQRMQPSCPTVLYVQGRKHKVYFLLGYEQIFTTKLEQGYWPKQKCC